MSDTYHLTDPSAYTRRPPVVPLRLTERGRGEMLTTHPELLASGEVCQTTDELRLWRGDTLLGPVVDHGTFDDESALAAWYLSPTCTRGVHVGDTAYVTASGCAYSVASGHAATAVWRRSTAAPDPAGTAASAVSAHDISASAHADLRTAIAGKWATPANALALGDITRAEDDSPLWRGAAWPGGSDGSDGWPRPDGSASTVPEAITALWRKVFPPSTRLLLRMDGTGTTFVDSSLVGHALTASGNITQDSAIQLFGKATGALTGGYIFVDTNSDLVTVTGDWTMDAWVYLTSMPTSDNWPSSWASTMVVMGRGSPAQADGCNLVIGATKLLLQSNDRQVLNGTHGISTGGWHHVAAVRGGSVVRLFVDGTVVATATNVGTLGGGSGFYVGDETGQGAAVQGRMAYARFATSALWTSAFTPPQTYSEYT